MSGGSININKSELSVGENLVLSSGNLYVNGGKIFVGKDFRIQAQKVDYEGNIIFEGCYAYIQMLNKEDYIYVEGDFVTQSYYSDYYNRFNAGVLEVKGRFYTKNLWKQFIKL
ncbi:hypothetical protein [Acetivibrio saccincola]|uniref:Uncharacterized protein n=1 Tax=Acetivibrio saccincola TaxID=1677857 RepID=A0A2S8RAM7_9FIRM|nr:hypothetical protein [Acetivibrio saccincola]PQQ66845.1 hypothetical protein B9R14_08880 [Acetivibrio saccincola]